MSYPENQPTADDVRDVYGDEAATLVEQGWTVNSAIDHVEGHCDRVLCTHPDHWDDE